MSDIESIKAFIRSVDLGPTAPRALAAAAAVGPSFVARGTLVSFDQGTPTQQEKDTLYSVLLAQLTADSQKNKLTEYNAWYAVYTSTLRQLGWVTVHASFLETNVKGVVKDFALEHLKTNTNITSDEVENLTVALQNIYEAGITGEATTILGRATANPHTGAAELAVAKVDQQLNVTLSTQALVYTSPKTYVTSALFVNIAEPVPVTLNTHQYSLSKAVADGIRDAVFKRVEAAIADNIRPVVVVN